MNCARFGLLATALLWASAASGSDEDASGLTTAATQTTFFFCRSGYEITGKKFLFSRTQAVASGVGVPDLVQSFHAYVMKNYGYPSDKSVSCPFRSGASKDLAESNRQQTIDNLHASNFEVIETDWVYKPQGNAPAAPARTDR